jgi:hypothetical protein
VSGSSSRRSGAPLDVDDADAPASTRRYALPQAHAEVLTDEDNPAYLMGAAPSLTGLALTLPAVTKGLPHRRGVPYADFGADIRHGIGAFNRPMFTNELADWVAALPNADRVTFEVRNAAQPPADGQRYDLACTFRGETRHGRAGGGAEAHPRGAGPRRRAARGRERDAPSFTAPGDGHRALHVRLEHAALPGRDDGRVGCPANGTVLASPPWATGGAGPASPMSNPSRSRTISGASTASTDEVIRDAGACRSPVARAPR